MHQEDNVRVPSLDDSINTKKWQTIPTEFENTNNLRNGSSAVIRNGNGVGGGKEINNYKWPPLLNKKDDNQAMTDYNGRNGWSSNGSSNKNNNEWSKNGSNGKDVYERYAYWPELDDNNLKKLGNSNNNGSLINSKALLGNGNGYPAEHDPLTGVEKDTNDRHEDDDEDEGSHCGLGSCQPKWARSFASTHAFMVVFLLAWILQGMYYTYFVSSITTIEKLFQIKSKTTGLLMSAVEIGQISTSLFLTYYAGRGHRPRWIACGMILFAVASFGCTIPHFIYGDKLLEAHLRLSGNGVAGDFGAITTSVDIASYVNTSLSRSLNEANMNLCHEAAFYENRTNFNNETFCSDDIKDEQANQSNITSIVLLIFTICLLTIGVGQTAVSTLGIPYIDDNVASRESPIYIAITIGVRILGPAAGFILGSFCTRIYVNPTINPGFGPTDPQWVGAWWLGLLLVSSCMAVTSLAMFMFPRRLKGNRIPPPEKLRTIDEKKKVEPHEEEYQTPKFRDFPKAMKRQLKNDILMFRTASSVLHLLPVAGLYTFLPKYMETQFNLPAHDANLISGTGGILVMGIGIVISGFVILKFSPTAKSVAGWIAFTAIVYSAGMAILMFVGCPMNSLAGFEEVKSNPINNFEAICSTADCLCETDKFAPICGADGVTYFSSCHAGCTGVLIDDNKIKYENCGCLANTTIYDDLSLGEAKTGFCDGHCKSFVFFISLFSFFVFMHSTGEVGSMLLIMRCTDPKDKAMAMGVIQFAIGLFGNVPCPIIYGAVVDSACLVWDTICDKVGACSLYDGDLFRHFFLGATAGIMFLAFIMDLVVWRKADRIDIDPESSYNSETDYQKAATTPESSV